MCAHDLKFFAKLPRCLVGLEACVSSHHWVGELWALDHDVRLLPPTYVNPYVKWQKNDAVDAEGICEAVQRPSMRFVEPKTIEQQMTNFRSGLNRHRRYPPQRRMLTLP